MIEREPEAVVLREIQSYLWEESALNKISGFQTMFQEPWGFLEAYHVFLSEKINNSSV